MTLLVEQDSSDCHKLMESGLQFFAELKVQNPSVAIGSYSDSITGEKIGWSLPMNSMYRTVVRLVLAENSI